MRRLVYLIAAGFVLSACGETPRPATQPRVSLKLALPDDGGSIRADRVEVSGTVTPADAAVRVAGEDAEVSGGEFSAEVELEPGGNVIDVTATSPGRRPATDAVRVLRDTRVEVPDVLGQGRDQAIEALRAADLTAVEERDGSWIDRLLPGEIKVCAMRPEAGALVDKGERVVIETAREC